MPMASRRRFTSRVSRAIKPAKRGLPAPLRGRKLQKPKLTFRLLFCSGPAVFHGQLLPPMMAITVVFPSPVIMAIVLIRAAVRTAIIPAIKRGRGAHRRSRRINHSGRRAGRRQRHVNRTRGLIDHRRRRADGRGRPDDHTRQEWQPDIKPDVTEDTGLRSRNGSD